MSKAGEVFSYPQERARCYLGGWVFLPTTVVFREKSKMLRVPGSLQIENMSLFHRLST